MAGDVLIDDVVITKPGILFDDKCRVRIRQKEHDFVSRGGIKLSSFLDDVSLPIKDACCIDVGISTGGFSDALLRRGVLHILGIDVAYGMLDYGLRKDDRISLLERTNARYMTESDIQLAIQKTHLSISDFKVAVMDVSFISILKVLPNILSLFPNIRDYIVLIKPQFEADRDMVEPGGVVQNPEYIDATLNDVNRKLLDLGFYLCRLSKACIKGPKGNQEYFAHLSLDSPESIPDNT